MTRLSTLLMLITSFGLVVSPAAAKPKKKKAEPAPAAAPAAPASLCNAMPYTVTKSEQAVGLELRLAGLKPTSAADTPPLINTNFDRDSYKREVAGELQQAIAAVSDVVFCRYEEAFPAKAVSIEAAKGRFLIDVIKIVSPSKVKDDAAVNALTDALDKRCASDACPEVPSILTATEAKNGFKVENFTKRTTVTNSLQATFQGKAAANGCWNYVKSSTASVPDGYLAALQGTGPIISQYLEGGRKQVTGLLLLTLHTSAVLQSAGNGSDAVQKAVQQNPALGKCLKTVADAAPAVPKAELPKTEEANAKPDSGEAKLKPETNDVTAKTDAKP